MRLICLALLLGLGCTPFSGRARDERDAGPDVAPADGGVTLPADFELQPSHEIQAARRVTAVATDLVAAWSGESALVVTSVPAVEAMRINGRGEPVEPMARAVDLSLGEPATDGLMVAPIPSGWAVYWGRGMAFVDAGGAVTLRVSLAANSGLRTGQERGSGLALAWRGESVTLLYRVCSVEQCQIARREVLTDGRISSPTMFHSFQSGLTSLRVLLDERGGAIAESPQNLVGTTTSARVLGLNPSLALDGTEITLDRGVFIDAVLRAEPSRFALLTSTSEGIQVQQVGAGSTVQGETFPTTDEASPRRLFARSGGYALAYVAPDHQLHSVLLDARGGAVQGSSRALPPVQSPSNVLAPALAASTTAEGTPLLVWSTHPETPNGPIQAPTPGDPSYFCAPVDDLATLGSLRYLWTALPTRARVKRAAVHHGAVTFASTDSSTLLLSTSGERLQSIDWPGPHLALLAVRDRLWRFVNLSNDLWLYPLSFAGDSPTQSRVAASRYGSTDRVQAISTLRGAVVSFDDSFVRLSPEGAVVGNPVVVRDGDSPLRLFPDAGDAFLWVELTPWGIEAQAITAGDQPMFRAPLALEGLSSPEAIGGWACGPECWIVATTAGLWRIDASGLRPLPPATAADATGLAAATWGDRAVLAMRRDGAVELVRFTLDGSERVGESARLPFHAEDGLSLVSPGDGHLLLGYSGSQPEAPEEPGFYTARFRWR